MAKISSAISKMPAEITERFKALKVIADDCQDFEEEKETEIEKEKEKVISTHKSPHSHPHPKFDIILALECVYREDLYQPLIDSILQSSVPSTLIFLGLTRLFAQVRDDKCRDMKI